MAKTFTEKQVRSIIYDIVDETLDVLARNVAQLERQEKEARFDNTSGSDRIRLAGQRELLLKLKREIIPIKNITIRVEDE